MRSSFCKFQQRWFWHEIREHLSALPGAAVMVAVDDPVIGSWIDFTFRGRSFTINSEAGEFIIFTEDAGCPEAVRAEIRAHFETFSDSGDGGDISLRRV